MSTNPSVQFVETLRPDLSATLEQFDLEADQAGFVGLKIAPVIEVQTPMGQYGVIELKEMLKKRDTRRQSDGGYGRGDGKGTKASFATSEHGFEEPVDERDAIVFGDWWDAEQLAAQRARDAVLRNHNERVIALATGGGVGSAGVSAGVWTATNSKPIDDIRAARIVVRNATGMIPNALCLDWEAFEVLRDNEQIIERLKYSGHKDPNKASINAVVLAQALGLDEVVVSGSITNSANENQAASLASMWPRTQALVYVKSGDRDTRKPRFMNTFHWGADGSQVGGVFEEYRDPARRRNIIRNRMETDEKIVYAAVARRITGIIT